MIVAVDGYLFDLEAPRSAVAHERMVTIAVVRGNQPRSYDIAVGRRTQIGRLTWPRRTSRQSGSPPGPGTPSPGSQMPLDFCENFHGIETVI